MMCSGRRRTGPSTSCAIISRNIAHVGGLKLSRLGGPCPILVKREERYDSRLSPRFHAAWSTLARSS